MVTKHNGPLSCFLLVAFLIVCLAGVATICSMAQRSSAPPLSVSIQPPSGFPR